MTARLRLCRSCSSRESVDPSLELAEPNPPLPPTPPAGGAAKRLGSKLMPLRQLSFLALGVALSGDGVSSLITTEAAEKAELRLEGSSEPSPALLKHPSESRNGTPESLRTDISESYSPMELMNVE